LPIRDELLEIPVDGRAIAGTLIVPDARMPGVLFLHGWGGNQKQHGPRAREVAALGCACLTVDMRGHAMTEPDRPSVTREDNLQDALAAYDRLVREFVVNDDEVAVVGSSYGGYLATLLTTLRPVKWLALRAPALYRDSDWNAPKQKLRKLQDLPAYRRERIAATDNRALCAANAYRGDVLIVESGRDDTIPHPVIENYRDAFGNARSLTYRVLDDADHALSDPSWRHAYTTILVNWITEMIAGKRTGDATSQRRRQDAMKTQQAAASPESVAAR
jgi:pimeloyl-ACP methyl ester carboxylesterase